jgi:hypothetical protein
MITKVDYIVLGENGLKDKDWSLDIGDLNFEFFFSFESLWQWFGDCSKMGVIGKGYWFLNTRFWK